jgi:hypothetical protein
MTRCRALFTLVLLLGFASNGFAISPQFENNFQDVIDQKNANLTGNPITGGSLVGGEDIANAVTIPSLPFSDTGNTCTYLNDYYEACPFTGDGAPDVVYKYTPTTSHNMTIDLCASAYDTKIIVYENVYTPGLPYACNDDANPPCVLTFRSYIECLPVTAGNTYYLVVDGYGADCGDYDMTVTSSALCPPPSVPCDPTCPEGVPTIQEGEPVCFDGYVDTYNAGCNSVPESFKNLPCDNLITVCGTAGDYAGFRDTDWYQLNLPAPTTILATVCASFNSQLAIIDGNIGCSSITLICGSTFASAGFTNSCVANVGPGLVWIFVADSDFFGWPCGSPYTLTITNACPPTSTEPTTWGNIKGLYR